MSRIRQIDPETATGRSKDLLDAVKSKMGLVPNMTRAMANSPAVLDGYLQLSGALGKGGLNSKTRERIALVVGQTNNCEYCLAAHSTIGKMVGLTPDQIRESRVGVSSDAGENAVLRFARLIVENHGRIDDGELADIRDAGFDDAAISEIVANVALNIFTNYFNHIAETTVDFPKAEKLDIHAGDVVATH